MLNFVLVVVLSLGAALAFALSTSFKHRSASDVSDAFTGELGALRHFAQATVSHSLWRAGVAADIVGLTLQVLALHLGTLTVVQPLLLSGLVFALMLRSRSSGDIGAAQIRWAVGIAASLAAALIVPGAMSAGEHGSPSVTDAVVSAVVVSALVIGCLLYARLGVHKSRIAPVLAVAVGSTYAATAALIKAVTDVAAHQGIGVLSSWQLYAVIVVGGLGLLLNQLAFQAGPLTVSAPVVATVDPVLSVVLGVVVYHEHVGLGPEHGAVLALLLICLVVATTHLTGFVPADIGNTGHLADAEFGGNGAKTRVSVI